MIVVGCPVANRAWCLPRYFDHMARAFEQAGEEPYFAFIAGTSEDTTEVILRELVGHGKQYPGFTIFVEEPDPTAGRDRSWGDTRFVRMAQLRNRLLCCIRSLKPRFFLSCDSDILLHEDALVSLLETSAKFDATGGKVFMQPPPSRSNPSYAMLNASESLIRSDHNGGQMPVDVIMALKLMGPDALQIDYAPHVQGEDIAWSIACRKAGLTLGFDSRVTSKHVMAPYWLDTVDQRIGW